MRRNEDPRHREETAQALLRRYAAEKDRVREQDTATADLATGPDLPITVMVRVLREDLQARAVTVIVLQEPDRDTATADLPTEPDLPITVTVRAECADPADRAPAV